MSLVHLIYASSASAALDELMLPEILRDARANNTRAGVTGMLLYTSRSFFQVLEGDGRAVDETFARIRLDPRHARATVIIREAIAGRAFGEWSMGFTAPSASDVAAAAGMNDFFGEGSCFDRLDGGRAKKLLVAFREGRWRTRVSA